MSNLYQSGTINIPKVTGNIVITAVAAQAPLSSITAVYTQSGMVYDTDTLDSLKSDLVVTANYEDGTSAMVSDYTLSGTLAEGTSTITVTYGGKSTTFTVTVTKAIDYTENPLANVTWSGRTSSKFEVQDCVYHVMSTVSTNKPISVRAYDENDNAIGSIYQNTNNQYIQLKPKYKYDIVIGGSSEFDPANLTMMPVDNRATAIDPVEVNLYDYKDVIVLADATAQMKCFAIPIANFDFTQYGVTRGEWITKINHINCIGSLTVDAKAGTNVGIQDFVVGQFYDSTTKKARLSFSYPNITTVEAMQQYIETNRPVIRFN